MNYIKKILAKLSEPNLTSAQREIIEKELELIKNEDKQIKDNSENDFHNNLYSFEDLLLIQNFFPK